MSQVKPSKIRSAKATSIPCDKHRSSTPNKISRIGVTLHNLDATERDVVTTVNWRRIRFVCSPDNIAELLNQNAQLGPGLEM